MENLKSKGLKINYRKILFILAVLLYLIFFLFPVFWVILSSLKTNNIVISIPPKFIFTPTLNNYLEVLQGSGFLKAFLDSIIIAGSTTLLTLFCTATFSYAITRFRIFGSDTYSTSVLIMRMIPAVVLMLPLYIIGQHLHLLDTYFIMIIALTSFSMPFQVWFLLGFFSQIPKSLDESARIDGCNWFSAFYRIILPLAAPGLAATTILTFFYAYNDIFFALVLTSSNVSIAPLELVKFVGLHSINWGAIMAGGVLLMIPTLALGLIFQRFLVKGLTGGAVKG